MPLQAGVFGAPHHRAQEDGPELAAVIGEMAMGLAKDGDDLRHFEAERPIPVDEGGAVTLRFMLLPFGRVRPNLNALPGHRSPIAGAAHGTRHPEPALADPIHDRRAFAIVVRPARHRGGRCEALRAGRDRNPETPVANTEPPATTSARRLSRSVVIKCLPTRVHVDAIRHAVYHATPGCGHRCRQATPRRG